MAPPLHRYRSGIESCYACADACDVLGAGGMVAKEKIHLVLLSIAQISVD